ncbi:hypothetical protein BDV93DRAFT_564378 [Ceratobasidium sp. AG-I]|nr:hypothetical protein BDV93DRAFT_564378 [Ceratobasidium sp. AG-I]
MATVFQMYSRSSTPCSANTVVAKHPALPPSRSFASCKVDATTPAPAPRKFADSSVETDPVITPALPSPSSLPSLPTVPDPAPRVPSFAGAAAQATVPSSTCPGPKHSHYVSRPAKALVSGDPV